MPYLLSAVIVVLAVNVGVAVAAAARGGERDDWLLGVLLAGTGGAGVLVVASRLLETPGLVDAALALTALALVCVVARSAAGRVGR